MCMGRNCIRGDHEKVYRGKTGRIQARTVNLLGVTPLDFGPVSHVEVLKENLKACGWKVLSTWAMGDELDAFLQAGEAEVNLVVSSVGLRAAKVLEEKFGTPYVVERRLALIQSGLRKHWKKKSRYHIERIGCRVKLKKSWSRRETEIRHREKK